MKNAISRILVIIVVAILVIVGIIAAFEVYNMQPTTTTSTTTTTTSTTQPSTSTSTTTTSTTQTGQVFVYEDSLEPTSLDPAVDYTGSGWGVIQNIYQTLIFYNKSSTTQFLGVLAESWTKSSDGYTWTFNIRHGVTFSNGDSFNANVMAYSLKRALAMNQGPSGLISGVMSTDGITAVDDYTLKIVLTHPSPAFLAILSAPIASAVDSKVVDANGGVVANQTNVYMTTHAVGTGPFAFKEWEKGDHITIEKNQKYWGGANGIFPAPKLSTVIFKYKTDALARILDIKSNSAHMIQIDLGHIAELQNQNGVVVKNIGGAPIILYLFMNTQKAPFNSTQLRQAVVHAVNYDEIVQKVYSGFASRYTGPLCVGLPGYNNSIPQQTYDPNLSKQLLTQAGYPNGQGLPSMKFVIWAGDPTVQNMAELIQSQLAAVNIKIELQIVSFGTFMDMQSSAASNPSHPVIGITEWGADYLDPDDFATPIIWSNGFDNPAGYNSSLVDQLVLQGRYEQNPDQRAIIYSRITQMALQDAPNAWLIQINQFFIYRDNVQGLYYNPSLGRIDFSQVSLSG